MIPENILKTSYRSYFKHRNKKYSKWVKCLTFPACNRCFGYKREWYEDTVDIQFEHVILKGSRHADEYLRFCMAIIWRYRLLKRENAIRSLKLSFRIHEERVE